MELSNSIVTLVGMSFRNALDNSTVHTLSNRHTCGLLLIEELRRYGFTLSHGRKVVPLPVVNARAQALALFPGVMAHDHAGIEVTEDDHMGEVGIVGVEMATRWTCPNARCGARWEKRGVHAGVLKRCADCGTRFFLRSN